MENKQEYTDIFFGRFVVGIDLGTTNCSVCYCDLEGTDGKLEQFAIEQLVAPGETSRESLYPSFCYLPGAHELAPGALALPWGALQERATGRFAREQGASVPERLIASAKSWLAHSGVNRRNRILPWGSELGAQMVSPLQVSSFYLQHIRDAWDFHFKKVLDRDGTPCLLSSQSVVVTVPASFDETARELTLEAARMAGLTHVTLLEEPLAAFYSWLSRNGREWHDKTAVGSKVIVVDVGGGTTDFSLVEIEDRNVLRRTAVGDHLLLGGDNMDMALARFAESSWKVKLPQRQWSQLCLECRRVKETLLAPVGPDSASVSVSGPGSSLFASLKTFKFDRDMVTKTILDGFFPVLDKDAPSPERRRGIQEMGLPYAAEAAVTRHLLQFLRQGTGFVKPTHVLFNGGAMLPRLLRDRVLDCLEEWCGGVRPVELDSFDLSLAVSEGAAYYGLARTGRAVRVKGGIARAYFLKIEGCSGKELVCVMPRDTEEGVVQTLTDHSFRLRTNQPVEFPLYASATRLGDKLGDLVSFDESFSALPPLCTALKYGRKGTGADVSAVISARLNETGVLELWCDVPETGHRFPLAFDLRGTADALAMDSGVTLDQGALDSATELLSRAFGEGGNPGKVMKEMEAVLNSPRQEWNCLALRHFADLLLANPQWRLASPEHEARWLNLCGFCLRPGIGAAGDEWRVGAAWKIWLGGLSFPGHSGSKVQWQVFFRRIAAGLKSGQQVQVMAVLLKSLLNADGSNAIRSGDEEGMEKWRTAASMERVAVSQKLKLLQTLLCKGGRLEDAMFWPVARLAARRMFHGTQDAVVPASKLEPLLEALVHKTNQAGNSRSALFALANSCRITGVRTVDVSARAREGMLKILTGGNAPEAWRKMLTEIQLDDDSIREDVVGEKIPLGLVLDE